MKILRLFIVIVLLSIIENHSYVMAQTHCQLEGTVWEYYWHNGMQKDFVAFVSESKSISYSYELDEFEFLKYRVRNDTLIMTTCNVLNDVYTERPVDSITYYYKKENSRLILLLSVLHYKDGHNRNLLPSDSYILQKKEN